MKKIGIITLYGANNYGNRLQNYAVHKLLIGRGYNSRTIVPTKASLLKTRLKRIAKKIANMLFMPLLMKFRVNVVRTRKFEKFTSENIPTEFICSKTGVLTNKAVAKYDLFVAGSDQVWNPTFEYFKSDFSNLLMCFASSEKRYCISPSFGVEELPNEWNDIFAKELKQYVNLCAREETGAKIIKELTGREDVVTTIDPTLMLDSSEWLKVSKKVKGLKEKYVLDYFLGQTPTTDEEYQSATDDTNGERIKLLDKTTPDIYVSGPSEFIYLVSKSSLICTDSFHACVFAILFDKPFKVFKRKDDNKDMFSRIETLLGMFGINANENVGKTIFIDNKIRDSVLEIKRAELINALKL